MERSAGRPDERLRGPLAAVGHREENDLGLEKGAPDPALHRLRRVARAQALLERVGREDESHGASLT